MYKYDTKIHEVIEFGLFVLLGPMFSTPLSWFTMQAMVVPGSEKIFVDIIHPDKNRIIE